MRVCIIGAGFCGSLLAARLLRGAAPSADPRPPNRPRARSPIQIDLLDGSRPPGPGLAYSTPSDVHWLNVPASGMSAWPEDPDHFLRWLRVRMPGAPAYSFVQRKLYGEYVREQLLEARSASKDTALRCHRDEAIQVTPPEPGGAAGVQLSSGIRLPAEIVVLATGNGPPAPLAGLPAAAAAEPLYVADPWRDPKWKTWNDGVVFVIGTGLTMVDVALELCRRSPGVRVVAMSRRGLLPQAHSAQPPVAVPGLSEHWPNDRPRRVVQLLRRIRALAEYCSQAGSDWREALQFIRPRTASLWQSLDERERARFLRHARSYWDVHRHRLAPQAGAQVAELRSVGRLQVLAGRLRSVHFGLQECRVEFAGRGGGVQSFTCRSLVNCTGPSPNPALSSNPLLEQLVKDDLLRVDPLGIGALTDEGGALLDADGRASSWLYALGPVLRPRLWETVAVPELREQAAALCGCILGRAECLSH